MEGLPAPLTVSTVSRDTIFSGSIVALPKDEILFKISDLTFRLQFASDAANPEPTVTPRVVERELHIKFLNFNNPLPTTWVQDVATLDGRTLNFAAFIQTVGSEGSFIRLVNYTLSLGGRVDG